MAQEQNNQARPGEEKFEIRMKPGCGKMLIGRSYKLITGETTKRRPKSMDELLEVEDEWLAERRLNSDGSPSEGPTAVVSKALIEAMLDANGKPIRIVEGYPMQKVAGSAVTEDELGNPIAPVADTYKPGRVTRRDDKTLIASHPDCTFEIVRKVA